MLTGTPDSDDRSPYGFHSQSGYFRHFGVKTLGKAAQGINEPIAYVYRTVSTQSHTHSPPTRIDAK